MSSNEWEEHKLEDVLECLIDYRGKTPTKTATGIPLVTAKIVKNGFVQKPDEYIAESDYESWMTRGFPEIGDVLLTTEAPLGEVAQLNIKRVALAQRLVTLRGKKKILDNGFLKYFLRSDVGQARLKARETGTTVTGIKQSELRQIMIPLPRIETQRAIAATLSALDDKIELNNRINKTLEEMAQALFKRWFVDFEFPGENGQPYKSSGGEMEESELGLIPKGWKILALGEIIETVNGFSYKGSDIKESVNAMMTIKNFNRNGGFNAVGFKEIEISERVKDKHHVDLFDVVVACTDITQKADIIGNPVLVLTKGKYRKIVISMDLVKVIVKHPFISNCLIYMFLKDIRFKKQALGYTSGTTVLHLNKMVFSDYPIIIPEDEKLLEKMSFIIEPIFHLIGMTIDNSQNLTSLRDTLLPKLMSGEIRVPIEEVAADV